jgi:Flp pilus assembly protein TadG
MKKKTIIKEQKGAALIEFAIVLIVLCLLAIGTSEIGLLLYNKQVIANASREGARAGIVNQGSDSLSDSDVKKVVIDYCNQRLIDFNITSLVPDDIDLNPETRPADFGDDFSVTVTYNYHFLVPSLFKMGTTIPIRAKTMMKMEDIVVESGA